MKQKEREVKVFQLLMAADNDNGFVMSLTLVVTDFLLKHKK